MTHHATMDKHNANNMFNVAILAAAAGAVAALLFAPKRGTEMREDLKTKYNDMKSKTYSTAGSNFHIIDVYS